MLRKLIKHEFKAMGKPIGVIAIGIVVISILAAGIINSNLFVEPAWNTEVDGYVQDSFYYMQQWFSVICVVLMISGVIIALALLLRHFYKSMFDNEGYLAFTLPVSTNQLILSKLLSALLMLIIIAFASILGISVILLITGIFYAGDWTAPFTYFTSTYIGPGFLNKLYVAEKVLVAVLFTIMLLITAYLGITVGSTGSGKNKKLSGAIVFVGINIATETGLLLINALRAKMYSDHLEWLSSSTSIKRMEEMDARYQGIIHLESGLQILLLLIVIAISYLLLKRHLDKKLNLQ